MLWIARLRQARYSRLPSTVLLLAVFALSACTQSMHKVSHVPQDAASLQAMSAKDQRSPLKSKHYEELLTLGYLYLENQNWQLAKLHFVAALEKNSALAEAYVGLGRIEMHHGQYQTALGMFVRANEINPKLLTALIGQAQSLRFEGKMNAAVEKINAAMVVSQDDLMVLNELAIIYDLMGRENLAEPLYREIVERSPDVAASHNNLGMNQMVRGQYPAAILSFMQALNLDSKNTRIKNNLATAFALHGDDEKALKIFIGTVGESGAYNNLGYLYMTQGKYDAAETYLRKALATNPMFYEKAQYNLDQIKQLRRTAKQ